MYDYVFELGVNLFQSFMFIGFFYLFFEPKYEKVRNIILFFIFVILNFAMLTYFTYFPSFHIIIDSLIGICIFEIYVLLFLKGNTILKIVMPFIAFLINTIISYGFINLTSFLSGRTFESIALESSIYRYTFVVTVNLVNLAVFLILIKIKQKEYNLKNPSNLFAFIGIPILAMAIIYLTTYILILTKYQTNILPYIITICVSMVVIAAIVWYMIAKISKDNNIKTELKLSELRADMYEKNTLSSNKQIEEMSKIKHDTSNQISSIDQLIVNKNYDEAHNVCIELIEKMKLVYTPINTNNPVLNAVLNVEMEKAKKNGISFKTEIHDEMIKFKNNTDLISLIGNMCDNAIEYLSKCPENLKYMELSVTRHNDYYIISCKNRIDSSILSDNPDLKTSKPDEVNHGKGLLIIKDVVNKYNGNVSFQENSGWFIINVILESLFLPEND